MIELLNMDKEIQGLTPVSSSEYFIGKSNQLHPEGLFSESIFGMMESKERGQNFSFINLHCKIIHPALDSVFKRLNRKILDAIYKKESFKLTEDGILIKDDNGEINGLSAVIDNFNKFKFDDNGNLHRKNLINMIMMYQKAKMLFITKTLVIPAAYRDIQIDSINNAVTITQINDYYSNIIRQSLQLQSVAPGTEIFDVVSAKMYQFVIDLYTFITSKIGKKQGLIRNKVLGRRLDFSARAVIGGGSDKIKIDEIGVPFKLLLKLFEPFLLHDLMTSGNVNHIELEEYLKDYNGVSLSIPNLRKLFSGVYNGDKLPHLLEELLKTSVRRVIVGKVLLAKRDPAIQEGSVQAFKPVMVDGNIIQLSVLACGSFNADFDGDQIGLFTPITNESIQDAKDKMLTSNAARCSNIVAEDFSKDIVIGIYELTREYKGNKAPKTIKNEDELDQLDYNDPIKYKGEVTTVGRVIFQKIIPNKYPFENKTYDKKSINKLAFDLNRKYATREEYVQWCQDIVRLGGKYYTISGISFTMDDLILPKSIIELKDKLKNSKSVDEGNMIIQQMERLLKNHLIKTNTNLGKIGEAGGLKNGYSQVRQILVAKGIVADNNGNPIQAISNGYADGLNSKEFFNSGIGSRKGCIDRVINTAETGYASRQLVYALQRVEADPTIKDCKTKKTVEILVTQDIARRLHGRFRINDRGLIESFDATEYIGKIIQLRSPIYCRTTKICAACYGDALYRNKTLFVGILAGHVLGEPLTQTIMNSFHVGGSVSMSIANIPDIITKSMIESDKNKIKKLLSQTESEVIAKESGKIEINPSTYLNFQKDVTVTKDAIDMPYGYFNLSIEGRQLNTTIDNQIIIPLEHKKVSHSGNNIVIEFKRGEIIFIVPPKAKVFSNQIKVITSLLSGKQPWKDADHFLMKIYDQYRDIASAMDLIHLEILASNLLRDKGNPSYPARLNKNYSPMVGSLKNIPALESWLQSLNFENINKSITQGLLYDRPTDETLLEKIVTGNL